ncbi:MAG: hypothetical protein ACLGGY_04565 [Gammaproteobacteria bacterium]
MQEIKRTFSYGLATVLALGVLSGCATQANTAKASESKPAMAAQPAALAATPVAAQPATASTQHYFLVFHENGRIYPIADAKNYLAFLDVNELIYTRTRIGAGPAGETVVFGIEKAESKDLTKLSVAEQLHDGKMEVAGPFYGEVVKDGRFHVFGTWQDFKDYLVNKEITYTFTEVGSGPKGETVIYAMNKKTSKDGRPVALIESFKQFHNIK